MSTTNPTKPPNVAPSTDANPPKSTAAATAQPPNTPSKWAPTKAYFSKTNSPPSKPATAPAAPA